MIDSSLFALEHDAEKGSWRFTISGRHAIFDGHFPQLPILPGIAHLAIAAEAARRTPGLARYSLKRVEGVRFTRPIHPDEPCEVVVTPDQDASTFRFELRCSGELASWGILVLE